jgi:hypothetical protein
MIMTTNSTSYPFVTKSQIAASIASDDNFVLNALQVMLSRQTAFEQDTRQTVVRNRMGFMSSHAVKGTALALKAQSEGLTMDEVSEAREIVSHYTRQLAEHFRQVQISENPELASVARLFSAQ